MSTLQENSKITSVMLIFKQISFEANNCSSVGYIFLNLKKKKFYS